VTGRYDTTGNPEAQFQSGSDNQVLANRIGIDDPAVMADVELDLLEQLYAAVTDSVRVDQRLTSKDLRDWHHRWLGNVYAWAGQYRTVNIGKGDFLFAASGQIQRLMDTLDSDVLSLHTPCAGMSEARLAEAIAVVHVELILIHPFREGNGRLSRLLAGIMALQAGWPDLDFSAWDRHTAAYFSAIQAGLDNYQPMQRLVTQVLRESVQQADG